MEKTTTRLLAIALTGLGIQNAAASIIINGGFESGNTGFSSDYVFKTPPNTGVAEYYIGTNANQFHSGFSSLVGYGGSGIFFIGNGSSDTTQSPWYQTATSPFVTLTTDANDPVFYRFEAQIANVYPLNGGVPAPDLAFEISVDGGVFGTFAATSFLSPGSWSLVYADTYFTSAPTTLAFRLRNQSTEFWGNDFAIDSIYFGLTTEAPSYPTRGILSVGEITNPTFIPEPSISLLGLLGTALPFRRRRVA
jgi:hypothetical protein